MRSFAELSNTFIKQDVCIGTSFLLGLNSRDLKLENILLDKSDNIKLADFGFTREYESKKLLETWCGTYAYAAPEMIMGERYSGEGIPL